MADVLRTNPAATHRDLLAACESAVAAAYDYFRARAVAAAAAEREAGVQGHVVEAPVRAIGVIGYDPMAVLEPFYSGPDMVPLEDILGCAILVG